MLSRRFIAAFSAALLTFLLAVRPGLAQPADAPLTVFAAASLKDALEAINARWSAGGQPAARFVFAASGALARQIEQAAPADLFLSADDAWMDYVQTRGGIRMETRQIIARNRLVVIAKALSARLLAFDASTNAMQLHIGAKLAIGDIKAVPAGTYAKAALERLGLWSELRPHLVMVENVRVALALVARGEAETGIVYASDAAAEPKVKVIGTFPEALHPPICYPAAIVAASRHPDAARFLAFLASPEAQAIFARFGFRPAR